MTERKHKNSRNSSAPYGMVKRLYDLVHNKTWHNHQNTPFVRMPAFSNYMKTILESYKEENGVQFVNSTASGIVQKIRSGDIANPIPQGERCTVYGNFEGETMDELAEKISDACFFKGEPIKDNRKKDRCVNAIFQYFILAMIEMSDEERKHFEPADWKPSDDCTSTDDEDQDDSSVQSDIKNLGQDFLALADILGDLQDRVEKIGRKLQ